jgi:8-oxo-dGTP pyrophosphatase MutT (NUDIX family)
VEAKPDLSKEPSYLHTLQHDASLAGRICVVGALIANSAGKVFVMKRSPQRRLFPGCWDIVGGHVDPGETLVEALRREVREETGWVLRGLEAVVDILDWESDAGGVQTLRREFDFLTGVDGDLLNPQLEKDKATEFRWVGRADLPVLLENRKPDDFMIYGLVQKAFDLIERKNS